MLSYISKGNLMPTTALKDKGKAIPVTGPGGP
jgi:hypothetical protein